MVVEVAEELWADRPAMYGCTSILGFLESGAVRHKTHPFFLLLFFASTGVLGWLECAYVTCTMHCGWSLSSCGGLNWPHRTCATLLHPPVASELWMVAKIPTPATEGEGEGEACLQSLTLSTRRGRMIEKRCPSWKNSERLDTLCRSMLL